CSTQDPSSVQSLVARILARPANAVSVEVRRLGGGFGGKETVATHFAAIAALAAVRTGRACKLRLDRDDDMRITGKRHEFFSDFSVGFDDEGRIAGLEVDIHPRCGNSIDQSVEVLARAAFHVDNCYHIGDLRATCHYWKTNTVSAVAFRGFGTPQAFLLIESILDRIARHLGLDPLAVRKTELLRRSPDRDTTPFGARIPFETPAPAGCRSRSGPLTMRGGGGR
ncbi:MAG: molybdopterin cofactor-binding domain-containing protein, partial [Ilumatobacteraceae bacterium]